MFGGTAKEYVHLFTDHEDTVHAHHNGDGELSFENEHHHCTFLNFALPDFINDFSSPIFVSFAKHFQEHVSFIAIRVTEQEIFQIRLRGPPALC